MIDIDENKKAIEILSILESKVNENKQVIEEKNKDIGDAINKYYEHGIPDVNSSGDLSLLAQMNYDKSINKIASRQLERYKLMLNKPYFGRVDFKENGKENPYYFGIETLMNNNEIFVNDWRSPIGNLYYECGYGKASFESPIGKINGEITLKRQYRFEDGKLVSYADTGLSISDELLIDILGKNKGSVMQNIVSTIQKEQNKAIRYNEDNDLLVLGVAGSGKTSIALHRIAYLVYKDSSKYDSSKICFITPNDIFYKYIDNVLPELGEQNVVNMSLNELARSLLKMDLTKNKLRVENKIDFLEKLINEKKSVDFDILYEKLNVFLLEKMNSLFNSKIGLKIGNLTFKSIIFKELYFNKFSRRDYYTRKKMIKEYLKDRVSNDRKVTKNILDTISAFVDKLLPDVNYFEVYTEFLKSINSNEEVIHRGVIGYEHIYPLCYIKVFFRECNLYSKYNHLLIDEYQDLNIFERKVVSMIFKCNKTFVGDFSQKLYNQNYELISKDFNIVELNESYRSTIQIFDFIQKIIKCKGKNGVKREGNEVKVTSFSSEEEERKHLDNIINSYDGKSMAIICKTLRKAEKLYDYYKDNESVSLLDVKGKTIRRGIVIAPLSLVKGLEFDKVIVYDASEENYYKEIDRNYFYIACSRAINDLEVIGVGKLINFGNK